jgi:hypothetical protein
MKNHDNQAYEILQSIFTQQWHLEDLLQEAFLGRQAMLRCRMEMESGIALINADASRRANHQLAHASNMMPRLE